MEPKLGLADELAAWADDLMLAGDTLRALARVARKGLLPKRVEPKVRGLLRTIKVTAQKLRQFGADDPELDTLLDTEG